MTIDAENGSRGSAPADGSKSRERAGTVRQLNTPDKLRSCPRGIGLLTLKISVVPFHVSLDDPRSTWELVTGSALRFLLTGLSNGAISRVHARVLADLHGNGGAELAVPTLVGVGYNLG